MRLRSLQQTIHSDLTLIDHTVSGETKRYDNVDCFGSVFEQHRDYVVIGIRAYNSTVQVSIKKKDGKD